jgi:hypothetical protein
MTRASRASGLIAWRSAVKSTTAKKPWYPFGGVTHAHYSLDGHEPVNGKVSQRISLEGAPATLGIAQDGVHVRKGATDAISVYLRSEKPGLTVIARVRNPKAARWPSHPSEALPHGRSIRETPVHRHD